MLRSHSRRGRGSAGRQGEGFTLSSAVVTLDLGSHRPWGEWPWVSVGCFLSVGPSLFPHSPDSSLTLAHFYLFLFPSLFPFTFSCVFFSPRLSLYVFLPSLHVSSFCPSHPSPGALSPGPWGVPPVGEAAAARLGQAVSGAHTPPPSRTQEGGSVRSAWRESL